MSGAEMSSAETAAPKRARPYLNGSLPFAVYLKSLLDHVDIITMSYLFAIYLKSFL